jgi:hypothetical protein
MKINSHQKALLAAIIAAGVASLIPFVQLLLLPLTYLNTHIHEFCHAIVAIATGGMVQHIEVNANGSGVTPVAGGVLPLIASAGYVGATIMGAAIILFGSNPHRAKIVMGVLAGVLAFSMALWVRGDLVGILSGFAWIGILGLASHYLKDSAALFFCQFVGVEQCLNSVTSVYQLLRISISGEQMSDASIMQSATILPASFWSVVWCGCSLIALTFTVRKVWKIESRPVPSESHP